MGFLGRFTKKKTTSDCCSVDIVPDDDAETTANPEAADTNGNQENTTQHSTS